MEEEYQVKELTQADLPSAIRWMTDYYYEGDTEQGTHHFEDHFHGGTTFVATRREEIVGFVTIRWVCRSLERATGEKIPFIHQIEVADPHKRKGLGNRLMAAAESKIAERSSRAAVPVGLDQAYGPAQHLYVKRGFVPDGRGAYKGDTPIKHGDTVVVNHDLVLWLIKELKKNDAPGPSQHHQ